MSILKSLFANKAAAKPSDNPETGPVKMNLEERMAFRREMLYEAIKVTLQGGGFLMASYRFRVVRNDKRGHQYSVMIDLSTDYLRNREGQPEHLAATGAALTKNAMDRYGIMVAGVYWRINEQMQGFDKTPRAEVPEDSGAAGGIDAEDSAPAPTSRRAKFERASADELAAFEEAWKQGQALKVGDRVYSSDLMPLSGDSGIDSKD